MRAIEMFTHVLANPALGVAEHYLVYLPTAAKIETFQQANRAALEVYLSDSGGNMIDSKRFVATKRVPFVVIQFPPGRWTCATSGDGQRFRAQGWFQSNQKATGPSMKIDFILDESTFDERWARFVKVETDFDPAMI